MKAALEEHPEQYICASYRAWEFVLSGPKMGGPENSLGYVFSAKLTSRGSKERDWEVLGRIAALVGVPAGPPPKSIEANPSGTHYWMWGGTATPEHGEAVVEHMKDIFHRKPKGQA
jgi:hypothetical protein